MKEMKTPEDILLKNAPVFQLDIDDTLKNKCIAAMKEYAKQWVDIASESLNITPRWDACVEDIMREIDAQ